MLRRISQEVKGSYSVIKRMVQSASSIPLASSTGCCQQAIPKRETDFSKSLIGEPMDHLQYDIDIASRLADPLELENNLRVREMKHINIHKLAKEYAHLMKLNQERMDIEVERNKVIEAVTKMINDKVSRDDEKLIHLKDRGKEIRKVYKPFMSKLHMAERDLLLSALQLPNTISPDTPDSQIKILNTNEVQESDVLNNTSHIEIAKKENLIKFSNIGDHAFFFKERLALLEQDLVNSFIDKLSEHDFIQMVSPEIFREYILEGSGKHLDNAYQLQKIHESQQLVDHFIRGNSVLPFVAYLSKMTISTDILPLRLFSSGRSYTPVVSNNALPGLFSSTQSIKVSAFVACESNSSIAQLNKELQLMAWNMFSGYHIPTRQVLVPAKELEISEQGRMEIQMFVPSLSQYVKVASVSLLGDYISRRLMIRHSMPPVDVNSSDLMHMVYWEVVDVNRLIALMLEHGIEKSS